MNEGILDQVKRHPDMAKCMGATMDGSGVELSGGSSDDLHIAFASPRVVFA